MDEARRRQMLDEVTAALERGDAEAAREALEPLRSLLASDEEVVDRWLHLLRLAPRAPGLVDDAEAIAAGWSERPELVLRASDALMRAAETRPPDEPILADGPAHRAAKLAGACLQWLDASTRDEPELRGYVLINLANALRLTGAGEQALQAYQQALSLGPDKGWWWFNLGLLHKRYGQWREALDANKRACLLLGNERPVLWNLAISATAVGDGQTAVDAFGALGFEASASDSGMPWVPGLPPMQLRVATRGDGRSTRAAVPDSAVSFEVVWVQPLSPCHGVVQTATHRDASVDYGDVVLWDGTPVALAEVDGRPVPRFPLLARLAQGDEHRFRFIARQHDAGDVEAFGERLPEGSRLFVHREQIEMLCARCAAGERMRRHVHTPPEEHRRVYGKLVVAAGVDLAGYRQAFEARLAEHPRIQMVVPGLLEAVGDTPAAGKAHQIWRGIERGALKTMNA